MPSQNLYFIAIVAPAPVAAEITAFKRDIAQQFESKAALKNMPHITLKAPFKLAREEHSALLEWFLNSAPYARQFQLSLNGFGSFPNKNNPVIFVQPEPNDHLAALQKQILRSFVAAFPAVSVADYEKSFHPHMTIGYRDLTPDNYIKAWQVYKVKEYYAEYRVHEVALLQHDGRQWNPVAHLQLLA